MVALVILTVCVKLVHWGYYVPEWNYRHGQGPWGRAIGQWLLPNWTLYTFHAWPEDLALATGRPVRQLLTPQHLAYPATTEARHVLLQQSEFENWPETRPAAHQGGNLPGLAWPDSSACTHGRDLVTPAGQNLREGRGALRTAFRATHAMHREY